MPTRVTLMTLCLLCPWHCFRMPRVRSIRFSLFCKFYFLILPGWKCPIPQIPRHKCWDFLTRAINWKIFLVNSPYLFFVDRSIHTSYAVDAVDAVYAVYASYAVYAGGSQNAYIYLSPRVAERISLSLRGRRAHKNFQKKISAYILFRPPIQCVGFTPLRTHIHFKWSLRVRTRGSTATANMSGGIKLCNWSSQVTKSPRLGSSHSLH